MKSSMESTLCFSTWTNKDLQDLKILEKIIFEDRLKERILDNVNQRTYTVKKCIRNIIDIANNEKIKSSKGYEYWATKHNLKTSADTVLLMREKGFKSISQLDEYIKVQIKGKIYKMKSNL